MSIVKYVSLAFLLIWCGELWAQTQIVTGKVYELDGKNKLPAIGVNIVVVNNQNRFLTGVTTDVNGDYRIVVPNEKDLSLNFSFIGMKAQTVKFTGQKRIDITLEPDTKELGEVVVTGERIRKNDMGLTDKQVVSATQRIKVDEMVETMPVSSIEDVLQGQLGGVDIILGGDPGAKSSIRIRGTSSLTGSNEPLIVIDGVPYDTEIDDDFDFSTANEEDFGALLNIAPADIESIEVLKDAAATAIWGTKGGNGVLLINTKKGSKGKTTFTFSTKFTVKQEPKTIPMLNGNQYTAMIQDAAWNTANAMGLANVALTGSVADILFGEYKDQIGYNPQYEFFDEYNQNVDWLDEVRQTAITSDNSFSMAGGGDKATYRFSLNYLHEQGTTIGTGLERLTSNLNLTYNFSDRLRVDANFSYTQTDKDDNYFNPRAEALRKMPNQSPYYVDDKTGEWTSEYFTPQKNFQGEFSGKDKNYNAVAMAHESYNNTTSREGKILFRLNYQLLPELSYTGYVSLSMKGNKNRKFLPASATGVIWTSEHFNRSVDALSDNQSLKTENKLTFIKNWNIHNIVATALFRTSESNSSSYKSETSGNASPSLSEPVASGSVVGKGSGTSKGRNMSAIASLHYTLLDRYMVYGTLNCEGNSSMGGDNRYGWFPSLGVAWLAHEESFLKDKEWLDQLKLRLSWGESGKSASGTAPYIGQFSGLSESYMGMGAIAPTSIQLNKLKWATSTEYNVGLDVNLFKSKLTFTFDWYTKTTKDLLQEKYRVPVSTGYENIAYFNSGEISNSGVEFRANYRVYKNKNWDVALNFNVSRNVNKVEKLPANMSEDSWKLENGAYATRVVAGDPVGSFYGFRYKGVYNSTEETYARDAQGNIMNDMQGNPIVMKNGTYTCYPGDARYEDVNHDGIINKNDIVYLGNANPWFIGGAGISVKYKTWALSTNFYGRFGQRVINQTRINSESMDSKSNQSTAVLKRWRSIGDQTDIPRALYDYGLNALGSDRFAEKCSYVRLKSLTLNYALPKEITQRWGITRLNFFITGYDLFTWTNYTGQDPEVSLPGSAKALAKDSANTPCPRRYSCGITLNF